MTEKLQPGRTLTIEYDQKFNNNQKMYYFYDNN